MRFGVVGPQRDSLLVAGRGLVELALLLERVAPVVVRLGIVRMQRQRLLVACQGLLEFTLLVQHVAQP